jgi:hypothetical protein
MLRPDTPYGESFGSDAATSSGAGPAADTSVTQTALLFNLSATPERENHGAFIDQVLRQGAGACKLYDTLRLHFPLCSECNKGEAWFALSDTASLAISIGD